MTINLGGSGVTTFAQLVALCGFVPADAGAVVMGDGSVSSPGMFFGSDTDTGFYRPAANTLNISAGGTEVASFSPTAVKTGAFYTDLANGYMGLGRTDPGYPIDVNKPLVDVVPGAANHLMHMYGYADLDALSAGGEHTLYYGHSDGGAGVTALKTIGSIFTGRFNGTWGPPGTVTNLRGVYAGARVQDNVSGGAHLTGDGTIDNGDGGFFEAANDTTGTGTINNARGVVATVRNTDGGVMAVGTALYSYVRNQTNGGGITLGRGLLIQAESAGAGITTYRGIEADNTLPTGSNHRLLYFSGTGPESWHRPPLAVGESTATSGSRLYVNENAASTAAAIFRASHATFTGDVVRVQADRAASTAYDLLTLEANSVVMLGVRGDGQLRLQAPPRFNGTNSTGAGTASLGTNSPAVTNSEPYTWVSVLTSDGSAGFIPVWK